MSKMRKWTVSLFVTGSLIAMIFVYDFVNDKRVWTKYGMSTPRLRNMFSKLSTDFRDSHPAPILILSYMRSGSTFLGDVIQSSPDVFYIFEPLWSTAYFPWPLKDLYGNDIGGTFDEMTKQILKAVFTCQISKLPTQLFDNDNFISVSRTTLSFKHCKKNSSNISSCIEQLQRECLRSKYVLTKCVKLQSDAILGIKEDFPDLKIVHMIRDPRATLNSRKNHGVLGRGNVSIHVEKFCNKVNYDTSIIRKLKRVYPTDVYTVYHNSFESNPLLFSRKLFTTLNLPLNSTAEKRLEELTSKKVECTRNYFVCTSKYNTADAVSKWRREIKYSFVEIVDSLCRNVYRAHGFLPFESPEMLKNLTFPSQN